MKTPALLAGARTGFPRRVHISYLFQGLLITLRCGPLESQKTLLLSSLLALSACTSAPVVTVERINVPTYIPIPATLTAPVKADLYKGITWGQAVGTLYQAVQTCNSDKAAIASLKPPKRP